MSTVARSKNGSPLRRLLVSAYFCLLALIVFGTQFSHAGFGARHHGWVTSHGLAIAVHATPANGFVGHARVFAEEGGALRLDYFDRYPFFFSAVVGALVRLAEDLATQVFIARQLMHGIFVLTMLFAWLLLRRLGATVTVALAGTTLAFAGYGVLYFRGALHFDQPAMLGMLALLWCVARASQEPSGDRRWLPAVTLVAVSMGRGFISLGVPGLWLALTALSLLRRPGLSRGQRLRLLVAHDAWRMLLVGALWLALMLGYNVAQEMSQRDVPLQETSIVASLQRRAPLGHEGGRNLTTSKYRIPTWDAFATLQADRFLRWFAPLRYESSDIAPAPVSGPLFLLLLAVALRHALRQKRALREPLLLTALAGVLGIAAMINLTAEHDYTIMHALGLALVFWLALLRPLQNHRRLIALVLAMSLALFLRASLLVEAENRDIFAEASGFTDDYNRIRLALEARDVGQARIFDTFKGHCPIFHSKCFAPGFYLRDHAIALDLADAGFVLTDFPFYPTRPWLAPDDRQGLQLLSLSLTPENGTYHLFDTADFERRHLPEGIAQQQVFGGEVALGHWELRESVQVQPCQRIRLESWWQAARPPGADYSIQLALVDLAGESRSASNDQLTTVNSAVWAPGLWFLDLRPLRIPCDTPAGEYPLVLSVYNPLRLAEQGPLPRINADGSAGDTWLYLTTLFVN
ncbi:MAG: hypothetical protein OXF44_01350 [Anaerolineaceae bacterium]|nr:hypothetical protein [Anaerolineaceae bacterium]